MTAFLLPTLSWATNGYFSHGTSIAEKGMAGASAAYSQDALVAATNPTDMVWQGNRYDIGAAIFSPMRSYMVAGAPNPPPAFSLSPGIVDSDEVAPVLRYWH